MRESVTVPSQVQASPSLLRKVFIGALGLRSGWRFALFNVFGFGFLAVLIFVRRALTPGTDKKFAYSAPSVLLQECLFLIALSCAVAIMLRIEKRPFTLDFLPVRQAFRGYFWGGVLWGIGALTSLLLAMRAFHTFYFGSLTLHGLEAAKLGVLWAVAFVAVGIFEESFSRGYVQATLAQGIGFWPAALVNSLIFGAVHTSNSGESALGIASVVCVAMFFCFTLWWTGSLWFAVGIHAGWDYAETFIFGVADSGEQATGHLLNPHIQGNHWINGGTVGPEGSVLVFLVYGLAALAFVLIYKRKPWVGAVPTRTVETP
jgi:membrane protease YdiL (CAAX protease family)